MVYTTAGFYSPLSDVVVDLRGLVWPNGDSEPPPDTITVDWDCPHDPDDEKESEFGVTVGYTFCFGLFLIQMSISVYIWKRWWKVQPIPIQVRSPYSQSDILMGVTIFIDFV